MPADTDASPAVDAGVDAWLPADATAPTDASPSMCSSATEIDLRSSVACQTFTLAPGTETCNDYGRDMHAVYFEVRPPPDRLVSISVTVVDGTAHALGVGGTQCGDSYCESLSYEASSVGYIPLWPVWMPDPDRSRVLVYAEPATAVTVTVCGDSAMPWP